MSTKKSEWYLWCGLAWCNSWGRRRSRCRSGTVPMPTSPSEGSSSGHYPRRGRPRRARTRAGARLDALLQIRDTLNVQAQNLSAEYLKVFPVVGNKKKKIPARHLWWQTSLIDVHLMSVTWLGAQHVTRKRRQPERWLLSSWSPAVSPDISKCWHFNRA